MALYDEGCNKSHIAMTLGVSRPTVHRTIAVRKARELEFGFSSDQTKLLRLLAKQVMLLPCPKCGVQLMALKTQPSAYCGRCKMTLHREEARLGKAKTR